MTTPVSAFVEMQQLLRPYDTSGRCALYGRRQNTVIIYDDVHIGEQRGIPLTTTFEEGWFYQQDNAASKDRSPDPGGLGAVRMLQPMRVTKTGALPIRDIDGAEDERLAEWESPGEPLLVPLGLTSTYTAPRPQRKGPREAQQAGLLSARLPAGHPALLLRGTEENGLHLLRAGLWPGYLVADHDSATQGELSSLVADVDGGAVADGRDGRLHRAASLDTALKAEPTWHPGGSERGAVSWWGGVDTTRPGVGRGLMTCDGPFGEAPDDPALGYMSESGGGPLSAGAGFADRHLVAVNSEGRAIGQGHLFLGAPWYLRASHDGPPEARLEPWVNPFSAGLPWHTFMRFDGDEVLHRILGAQAAGGAAPGLWRWQTPVPLYVPDPDRKWPPFPPPPLPPPPGGPGGGGGPGGNGGGGGGPGGPFPPGTFPPGGGLIYPQPRLFPKPSPPRFSQRPVRTLQERVKALATGPSLSQPPGRAGVAIGAPTQPIEGSRKLAASAALYDRSAPARGLDDERRAARESIGQIAGLDSQVWLYNELGLSGAALRPAPQRKNLLYALRGVSGERVAAQHRNTPTVGRLLALGAEDGCSWHYSARGTNARYRHGHAEGGFWLMPPENDPRFDCPDDHSLVSLGLWCAALDFAAPLQSTGRGKSGFRLRLDEDDGALKFLALSAAGEETELRALSPTGSLTEPTTDVSGAFTTLPGFIHFVDCSASAATTTLPASGTVPEGTRVAFVGDADTGANKIELTRGGGDTINGTTTYSITAAWGAATLVLRGTEWRVIAAA